MKAIKVTELKAHLSEYLRLASRGTRVIVKDRDEPIAQIGPLDKEVLSWRDRLARDGRLRRGTQRWSALRIEPLGRTVDVRGALDAVREEPHERRVGR